MADTKPESTFDGPAAADLTRMLGRSHLLWDELIAGIERAHSPVTREWHLAEKTGTRRL